MLEFLVELGRVFQFEEFAVHLDALVAILEQFGEFLAILALAAPDHRRQQVEARALGQFHRPVDHLADRLALDRQAGGRRIGNAHARPQQAHIVIDLRHGADGGARVAAGRLLLDGNGGRQALDAFHVRLLHQFEELARIGR